MSDQIQVAGVQMDIQFSDPASNLLRMSSALEDPRVAEAQLVVFPECAVTGICFDSREQALGIAESIPGPTTDRLDKLARSHGKYLAFGTLERDGDALFNACVLTSPSGIVGVYRKTHLPFLGVDRFTTPGGLPPPVYDIGSMRVGIHICYDASFPETTRTLMLAGADLAILPTNWPPDAARFAEHLAPVRAFENHMYFMIVNRVGREGGFQFIGSSRLCTPFGQTEAECASQQEELLVGTVCPAIARQKHIVREAGRHSIDRIADRRPDLYGPLAERPTTGA